MCQKLLSLLGLSATISTSQAVVTFVSIPTDLSNISVADGSPLTGAVNTVNNQSDGLWRQRDGFGDAGTTVLEGWDNGGGAAEDVPVLIQTITGLIGGETYDVYINYTRFSASAGNPDGTRGGIRGSLNGTDFTFFDGGAGGTAGTPGFVELTGFLNADRSGARGYLGTAVANGSGEIQVFADDGSATEQIGERAWFVGSSYELVPEPSTALLSSLAAALGLLRRRR